MEWLGGSAIYSQLRDELMMYDEYPIYVRPLLKKALSLPLSDEQKRVEEAYVRGAS